MSIASLADSAPSSFDNASKFTRVREKDLHAEALIEVERRSTRGIYIYLVCWLGLVLANDMLDHHPTLAISVFLVWAVLAACRQISHHYFQNLVKRNATFARILFLFLVFAGIWFLSGLTAISFHWRPLQPLSAALLLITAVVCCSSTLTLSIEPMFRYGMPISVMVPMAISLSIDISAGNLVLIFLVLLFGIYLWAASKQIYDDYWYALRTRALLQEKAANYEKLSVTDALTQIPNRLHFDRRISHDWARALRKSEVLSVLLIDIDHFKKLNDTYGHSCGDEALKTVARSLKRCVRRETDTLARYGGEEFAVVLPDTPKSNALVMAERMRMSVNNLKFEYQGQSIHITCSVGLVTVHPRNEPNLNPAKTVEMADQALYTAKTNGRNRVYQKHDLSATS